MQDLSYKSPNAVFRLGEFVFSMELFSFQNVYTLDNDSTTITSRTANTLEISCSKLLWAGGQEKKSGYMKANAILERNEIHIQTCFELCDPSETIRCAKLIFHHVPRGTVTNLIDARPREVPSEGLILHYPEAWREVGTPLIMLKNEKRYYYFRSLDNQVRAKRFILHPESKSHMRVELIFEEKASQLDKRIYIPTWIAGTTDTPAAIEAEHRNFLEKAYQLEPWETRTDVPLWAKDISLIAAIHGQHWTGYIFNDYSAIEEKIKRLSELIDPTRLLVFLPGWEGRYYWQYGNYQPNTRMGGEAGFRRIFDTAHSLGVHVMPMFGANMGGTNMPGYQEWGASSEQLSISGNTVQNSVDWDGSRHYDHSCNRLLNPAAPKWQNHLFNEIHTLADEYGFDGVFLDIAAGWNNDARYDTYAGVCKLVERLKENRPDLLVAGEAWYDGISKCIGLAQCGESAGHPNWASDAYKETVLNYTHLFGHLSLGNPDTGSTGVHELGWNPHWRVPFQKGIIPTLTLTEQPIDPISENVRVVLDDAVRYAEMFLK